jgi:hypothetical protein
MTQDTQKKAVDRRSFFRSLGGAAAVAGAGAAAGVSTTPALAVETGNERTKARYQESEHVKNFYRTNRY